MNGYILCRISNKKHPTSYCHPSSTHHCARQHFFCYCIFLVFLLLSVLVQLAYSVFYLAFNVLTEIKNVREWAANIVLEKLDFDSFEKCTMKSDYKTCMHFFSLLSHYVRQKGRGGCMHRLFVLRTGLLFMLSEQRSCH